MDDEKIVKKRQAEKVYYSKVFGHEGAATKFAVKALMAAAAAAKAEAEQLGGDQT